MKPYHDTVTEMLAVWDAGDTIWSIDLGGLGPGYEQAIQCAAVEFARAGKDKPDREKWDELCMETFHRIDGQLGGMTGAMYDAAKWLAWKWCHAGGPDALIKACKDKGEEDRIIQVSQHWPQIDALPAP